MYIGSLKTCPARPSVLPYHMCSIGLFLKKWNWNRVWEKCHFSPNGVFIIIHFKCTSFDCIWGWRGCSWPLLSAGGQLAREQLRRRNIFSWSLLGTTRSKALHDEVLWSCHACTWNGSSHLKLLSAWRVSLKLIANGEAKEEPKWNQMGSWPQIHHLTSLGPWHCWFVAVFGLSVFRMRFS